MKFKLLIFLVTFALGMLAWLPFRPVRVVPRHWLSVSTVDNDGIPIDFHTLHGSVNNRPASLRLSRAGNRLYGYYSMRDSQTSVPIRGTIDEDNCVSMLEFGGPDASITGWFSGKMKQETESNRLSLTGSWSAAETGEQRKPFRFEEDATGRR